MAWSFDFRDPSAGASAIWKRGLPESSSVCINYALTMHYWNHYCRLICFANDFHGFQVFAGSMFAALFDTAAAIPFFYTGRILPQSCTCNLCVKFHDTGLHVDLFDSWLWDRVKACKVYVLKNMLFDATGGRWWDFEMTDGDTNSPLVDWGVMILDVVTLRKKESSAVSWTHTLDKTMIRVEVVLPPLAEAREAVRAGPFLRLCD